MTPHGIFYWNELVSDDADAATAFYTTLLGWSTSTMDMGNGTHYTLLHADGVDNPVAGLMQRPADVPDGWPDGSFWGAYIAVDNVDAVASRVAELGGTLTVPPFSVPGVGRMAFLTDPSGATVAVMTPAEPAEPAE